MLSPSQLSYKLCYKPCAVRTAGEVLNEPYSWGFKLNSTKVLKSLQTNFKPEKTFVRKIYSDTIIKETSYTNTQEQSDVRSLKNKLSDSGSIHANPSIICSVHDEDNHNQTKGRLMCIENFSGHYLYFMGSLALTLK